MTSGERPEQVDPVAWEVARRWARRLADEGAAAVALFGSHVRGTAHRESDIDLYALGDGPDYLLDRDGDFLVSITWRTPEQVRESFRAPFAAPGAVPAWRLTVAVSDPEAIVATLRREALTWTWEVIGERETDLAVAAELTGYAEEVHKLVTNLERGRTRVAAIQRSVLALRMARIIATHQRLLYPTEDELWDLVAARVGPDWERAQSAALGERGESLDDSCRGALELFVLAARQVAGLLDERQLAVVAHACALAGYPLLDGTEGESR